jgi:heme oxygenase (biliverdin-IX-beta and delta-forming)
MIFEQLKSATRPQHEAMEHDPLSRSLLEPTLTLHEYSHILQVYLGFYAPLEVVLFQQLEELNLACNLEARRKTPLLLRDLHQLGMSKDELLAIPHCDALPAITSEAAGLGCMYVLEGATLGGQLIKRQLQATLGLNSERGCAFFTSYGPEVGPRWKEFRALLEAKSGEESYNSAVVAAASATFTAMLGWFARNYWPSMVATAA